MREISGILLVATLLCIASCASGAAGAATVWRDATDFEIEGRGWKDTETPYDRLPARAKGAVPDSVWNLGKDSAGLCVRFQTRAKSVSVRWELNSENLAMPHMPATGVSGVDLYRRETGGVWQFVANGRPTGRTGNTMIASLPESTAPTECLLYLPLYNGVKRVEIGTDGGPPIETAPARPTANAQPIVYYGTSIAQGGCASRPGNAHVAMLGRMLDRPMINLGFSGSGKMEPAVSQLLAELDPALFVIDCTHNMGGLSDDEFTLRAKTLVETIRKSRPRTPILFVGQSEVHTPAAPPRLEALQARIVRELRSAGDSGLSSFPGRLLLGLDGDGTVDGVHPNDLGFRRHADALAPAIVKLLHGTSGYR